MPEVFKVPHKDAMYSCEACVIAREILSAPRDDTCTSVSLLSSLLLEVEDNKEKRTLEDVKGGLLA